MASVLMKGVGGFASKIQEARSRTALKSRASTQPASSYQYEELPQTLTQSTIRVLQIYPGRIEDPLVGKLMLVDLGKDCDYVT